MTDKNIIKLEHIVKKFDQQTVLNDINLTVSAGQIIGFIGPSGAGKSTVIKILLGTEVADSGTATVFDQTMPNRQLLGRIGYMAQTDALYDSLTAQENLQFYADMKGLNKIESQKEIKHVLEVVDLTKDAKKRVSGFSGGMKRRLSLAIALMGQNELLILDEPTVGIDPALRRQIWAELKKLKAAGRTILVTTHVMDEAELVDEVALLLDGKIIAYDKPKELEKDYHVPTIEDVFLKAEEQNK